LPKPLEKFILMVLEFAATLLIASLSYRFIEKPILNLKDKYFPIPKEAGGV